ncbi:MAG: response regulator [Candidatus Sumerlaeia bacterium]|nr:response regulator [Candidatus Sumerlaeia bacterium]
MPRGLATILCVDDDPDTLLLLRTTFSVQGFTVLTALNGREALVRLHEAPVDVVIMDLEMPVMGGLETIEAIRSSHETHAIPVLVVSGAADREGLLVQALQAGANDYLSKPYNPTSLLRRVEILVDLHHLHRERSQAVREMAGAASHELSQPATALLGHLELLVAQLPALPPDVQTHIHRAHAAALDLAVLIKRIQKIEEHRTVPYLDNRRIVDIGGQGQPQRGAPFAEEYQASLRETDTRPGVTP